MMRDPVLQRRVPTAILLSVIGLITVLDWIIGFHDWMMVPVDVVDDWEQLRNRDFSQSNLTTLATTLTAGFLHGGLGHLFGNMMFLWLFGVVVCELCGWRWLVGAFLITAIGGSIGQIIVNPDSTIPVLGASGALMGLEGLYFGLACQHPRPDSHVWPLARPVSSGQLAAAGAIGVALDFMGVMGPPAGIAYGAHIGGFMTGIILSVIADRFVPRYEER